MTECKPRSRKLGRAAALGGCLAVFAPALVASGQGGPPPFVATNPYVLITAIAPPAGDKITSFDISWVDPVRKRYYIANRTSKAIIVVDTNPANATFNTVVGNFKPGFKGFTGNNDTSGPDGVLTTESELYVGDAPSKVWVLDPTTGAQIVAPISTSATSPDRADEGCYDPTNKIVAFVNNADAPPFITFMSTVTHSVLGQITFDGMGGRPLATDGAEQCQWNPRDGKIYLSLPEINGPGDNSVPGGVVRIDALTRTILNVYLVPVAACTGPQGLAIGPAPQLGLGCNSSPPNSPGGLSNTAIIQDATGPAPGSVVHAFPGMGGGDMIWYDPSNNKYFLANRAAPGGEALFIINAATFAVQRLGTGTGSNAHSVAVDANTNLAYVPTSSAATSGLCSSRGAVDANGCILVFGPRSALATFATHDFNGDGKSDIAWRQSGGAVAAWLMNGAAVLQAGSFGVVTTDWTIVGQRDFNGDKNSDFAWRNTPAADGTSQVAIWLLSGLAAPTVGIAGNILGTTAVVGTGDFDGDGKGDILFQDTVNGTLIIWFMNGFSFKVGVIGGIPPGWVVAGVSDFSGDGKADILLRDTNSGTIAIWFMNGATVTSAGSVGALTLDWQIAGTGDFNGDGLADIVFRNVNSGAVVFWLMNGFQIALISPPTVVPGVWQIAETGDFNGDTKSDVLWRNTANGDTVIWFMNGVNATSIADLGIVTLDWVIQGLNAD